MASDKTYLLALEFYNIDRKMKSIIRYIFISIIMHPNLMHFRRKISFKSALEIFIPVSEHSRTALIEDFKDNFSSLALYILTFKTKIKWIEIIFHILKSITKAAFHIVAWNIFLNLFFKKWTLQITIRNLVFGYESNCVHEEPGIIGGIPFVGEQVFLRDPRPYLREFRRKPRKTLNG